MHGLVQNLNEAIVLGACIFKTIQLDVDGHRADITVIKAALTLAAFAGRRQVLAEDIKKAARLTLPHRMRRRPFEEAVLDWSVVENLFADPA